MWYLRHESKQPFLTGHWGNLLMVSIKTSRQSFFYLLCTNHSCFIGSRWSKRILKYSIIQSTTNLPERTFFEVLQKAFSLWQNHINLNFEYSDSEADIEIYFLRDRHGDRMHFSNSTIAHAFTPGEGGNIHLRFDHNWTGMLSLWLCCPCMYNITIGRYLCLLFFF